MTASREEADKLADELDEVSGGRHLNDDPCDDICGLMTRAADAIRGLAKLIPAELCPLCKGRGTVSTLSGDWIGRTGRFDASLVGPCPRGCRPPYLINSDGGL